MPGFFDLFFRNNPDPEPAASKPEKVKKAQKSRENESLVEALSKEVTELREMVTPHASYEPQKETEE